MKSFFIVFFLFFLASCQSEVQPEHTASNVSEINYLMGNYKAEEILVKYTNPLEKTSVYLHKDTVAAFSRMIAAFEKEKNFPVKQHIYITSGFRSYEKQKEIWEGKFSGKRSMRVAVKGKTTEEINNLILEFSSAPGTSRHHWGTDFDINILQNSYYQKGGRGQYIYQWLADNAAKYGFCQPYNSYELRNNKGYREERWHWSYKPVASSLTKKWIELWQKGEMDFQGKFMGSDSLGNKPLEYVQSVNQSCL